MVNHDAKTGVSWNGHDARSGTVIALLEPNPNRVEKSLLSANLNRRLFFVNLMRNGWSRAAMMACRPARIGLAVTMLLDKIAGGKTNDPMQCQRKTSNSQKAADDYPAA